MKKIEKVKVICTNGTIYEREYTPDDLFFNIDAHVNIPLKGQIVVDYTKKDETK
jgi:hypothetical protein